MENHLTTQLTDADDRRAVRQAVAEPTGDGEHWDKAASSLLSGLLTRLSVQEPPSELSSIGPALYRALSASDAQLHRLWLDMSASADPTVGKAGRDILAMSSAEAAAVIAAAKQQLLASCGAKSIDESTPHEHS